MTPRDPNIVSRRFQLHRDEDKTGISGVGCVADGVMFPDGTCGVHWRTDLWSVTFYPDLKTVDALHGHGGATRIVWLDAA